MTKSVVREKGCLLNIINYIPTSNLIRGIGPLYIYIYIYAHIYRAQPYSVLALAAGWMDRGSDGGSERTADR
jgi:hypothetical protein